jgi:hypothetical protein
MVPKNDRAQLLARRAAKSRSKRLTNKYPMVGHQINVISRVARVLEHVFFKEAEFSA